MKIARIAIASLALVSAQAWAVEPAVISFSPVTKYDDGTPIPAGKVVNYNIYQGVQGQPKTKVGSVTTTGLTITTGLVPGTTYCFAATAVVDGVEGKQNEDVNDDPATAEKEGNCKLIPLLTPGSIIVTVR